MKCRGLAYTSSLSSGSRLQRPPLPALKVHRQEADRFPLLTTSLTAWIPTSGFSSSSPQDLDGTGIARQLYTHDSRSKGIRTASSLGWHTHVEPPACRLKRTPLLFSRGSLMRQLSRHISHFKPHPSNNKPIAYYRLLHCWSLGR